MILSQKGIENNYQHQSKDGKMTWRQFAKCSGQN